MTISERHGNLYATMVHTLYATFNIISFATIKQNSAPTCTYEIAPQMHSHHNYSADRLSFFLQHLISMRIQKLSLPEYQELFKISVHRCIPIVRSQAIR